MTQAPPSTTCSDRVVVVWRPRPSPRQLVQRRHTGVHPPLAQRIAPREHPVADGECIAGGGQFRTQCGQLAGRVLVLAVVQCEAFALQLGHAHQRAAVGFGGGRERRQLLDHRAGQTDGAQGLEGNRLEHGSCRAPCRAWRHAARAMPRRAGKVQAGAVDHDACGVAEARGGNVVGIRRRPGRVAGSASAQRDQRTDRTVGPTAVARSARAIVVMVASCGAGGTKPRNVPASRRAVKRLRAAAWHGVHEAIDAATHATT
jgi:hypothetical protein